MSFNATRLTCFALISALETDCRESILSADASQNVRLPEATLCAVRKRLARARLSEEIGLDVMVQYLDFADAYQTLLANRHSLGESLTASLMSVSSRLESLIEVRNRVAHSRPMEIGDLSTTSDIASALVASAPDDWPSTTATLHRLGKEPAYVLGLTVQLPADLRDEPQHNLPIPDFDETGFLGRSAELKRVKKAILGPYPVVSVLGDGGIGKTAVALKVAYDLLDTPGSPFDAIVWASAKSTTLTNGEIATISGAIQDSLGLFEAAAKELAGQAADENDDPISEVLEYLEQFKVLLILDNLETVTDRKLRDFLLELPLGSKVLLTSRIGLGIENPVKLEPLSADESKRLLRTLAGLRSVEPLKEMSDEALTKLVSKLRGHPLYIKWLVAGVQSGKRPADLVNDNSLLLDFCMSNVWDKLSPSARKVLHAMQIARGQRNLGELAFLTDLSPDEIQGAILDLMATNFVSMRYSAESALDGAFETGEFASQYLGRHQPPSPGVRSQVSERARELEQLGHDFMAESRSDPFHQFTIDVRDRSDVPTARLLHTAMRDLRAGNYDLALQSCTQATVLSPTYGEVWRVQGLVNLYRNDLSTAEQDHQRAFEYADRSPAMCFHYARFLVDYCNDSQGAINALNRGLQSNPNSPMLLFLLGEVLFREEKYVEAVGACSVLATLPQLIVPADENATLCLRAAVFGSEYFLWRGNVGAAAELLESTSVVLDRIGNAELDESSADWLIHLSKLALRLQTETAEDEFLTRRAQEFHGAFVQRIRTIDSSLLTRRTGQIKQLDQAKRFGFIVDESMDRFFHRNDLIERDEWQSLGVEVLVAFEPDSAAKGPRATRLRALI